ncbi:hypothetical protein BJX65DRAFT_314285 [Aspergillus insuetus]
MYRAPSVSHIQIDFLSYTILTSTQAKRTKSPKNEEPAFFKAPPLTATASAPKPPNATDCHVYNTDDASTLERFKIREICEGWPLHRDACDWQQNFRDEAIKMWAEGWERGGFIMHRALGHVVEIKGDRAIDKMKVTISHCRFIFFLEKQPQGWQIFCNHPIYQKDKPVPVDPGRLPKIDYDWPATEPKGYKYLAYGMRRLRYPSKQDLPQLFGKARDDLYNEMAEWFYGKDIDFSVEDF